jgi:hypothetical protein
MGVLSKPNPRGLPFPFLPSFFFNSLALSPSVCLSSSQSPGSSRRHSHGARYRSSRFYFLATGRVCGAAHDGGHHDALLGPPAQGRGCRQGPPVFVRRPERERRATGELLDEEPRRVPPSGPPCGSRGDYELRDHAD